MPREESTVIETVGRISVISVLGFLVTFIFLQIQGDLKDIGKSQAETEKNTAVIIESIGWIKQRQDNAERRIDRLENQRGVGK